MEAGVTEVLFVIINSHDGIVFYALTGDVFGVVFAMRLLLDEILQIHIDYKNSHLI